MAPGSQASLRGLGHRKSCPYETISVNSKGVALLGLLRQFFRKVSVRHVALVVRVEDPTNGVRVLLLAPFGAVQMKLL